MRSILGRKRLIRTVRFTKYVGGKAVIVRTSPTGVNHIRISSSLDYSWVLALGKIHKSSLIDWHSKAGTTSMSIQATCDACGRTYSVPDKYEGKRLACKECGETFEVQGEDDFDAP